MGASNYVVEFSPRALQDLAEVVAFIAADNPAAAELFGHRLIDEAEAIGPHPFAGRMVPEFRNPEVRERIFRAYRIIYRIEEQRRLIVVSRFWHAARGKPGMGDSSDSGQ